MNMLIAGDGPSNPAVRRPDEVFSIPPSAVTPRAARWTPWLMVGLLLAAVGCGNDSRPAGKTSGGATAGAGAKQEDDDHCRSILASIEDIFQLQRLGRTTP